jgi:HSP20 family protein
MAKSAAKVPVKKAVQKAAKPATVIEPWRPIDDLRREVDRLFENFGRGFWATPFGRPLFDVEPTWPAALRWPGAPAVDIVERDDKYELTAELPGLDEKDIEVKVVEDGLTIKGEKQEEKEEKKKGYHLKERRFGAFERSFQLPKGVDADKIDARFEKGVLMVTLPKKPEAKKATKKIAVKTG